MLASKLLIDEPPLQVLPSLAILIGLNESIFLQQVHWLTRDFKPDPNGRKWIRRTYAQWKDKHFPFWSIRTLERVVGKLTSDGLILTEQRDKKTRNRDNYYAVDYQSLARKQGKVDGGIESAKMAVSEGDRLAGSDTDKLAGSLKDQIIQSNQEDNQEARTRQPLVKPINPNQEPKEPKMKCPANILGTHPEIREMFPEHGKNLEMIVMNWREFRLGETRNTLRTEDQWYHNCLAWIGRERVRNGNGKTNYSGQSSTGNAAGVRSGINTSLVGRIKRA